MGKYKLLARAWNISESEARRIVKSPPRWFSQRVDNAVHQGVGRPIGAGLKTAGAGAAVGGTVIGGSSIYGDYTKKQIADQENAIDAQRADALAALLNDDSIDQKEKERLIKALDDADFFRNTDSTPETWFEKLGLSGQGLNPVTFFGGGLSGVVVFLIVVWAVVRIAQSR